MLKDIKCMPLLGTTDGPLFGAPEGTLSELTNMVLQPGGYTEARGGIRTLLPSGGSAPTFITAGGYSSVHELSTSGGWIMKYDSAAGAGTQYSNNMQFATTGWEPFETPQAGDIVYFGSDLPFSRITINHVRGTATSYSVAYEYYNGSSWTALTTSETVTWYHATTSTYQQEYASWTTPSDWAATTIGDAGSGHVLKYWMRVRLTAVTLGIGFNGRITFIRGNWSGMREIYAASHNPLNGTANAKLLRYGQNGTAGEAFAISSALFSGYTQPTQLASYRGRLYMANGKEAKCWDGYQLRDIGLPVPSVTISVTSTTSTGSLEAGTYRYYVAWGYGPLTTTLQIPQPFIDPKPLYGYGQAYDAGNITLAGTGLVTVDLAGTVVPDDVSCIALYRTPDLTSVDAAYHTSMPAQMNATDYRAHTNATDYSTCFGGTTILDSGQPVIYPPLEAKTYNVSPPIVPKWIIVYQNRLLIGDDNYWYWSDAFEPDSYNPLTNFIALAKSSGGRHMGGAEFADQAVLYTEDQTWGLTNIDLDAPQLFPIHPGVGCIAPDSVATGYGVIVWAARDGIYIWSGGSDPPRKLSWAWDETFGKMSYETHGGSRAVIHNHQYDIRLAPPDHSSTGGMFRLNLLNGQWSTISFNAGITDTLYPFGPVHGPLGSEDPGGLHPAYAHGAYSGADSFAMYLGEITTQDAGTNFTCSATMHFPLAPSQVATPFRSICYYQAADGWQSPTLSFTPTSVIGGPVGTITTGTPDTGSDYSVVGGAFSQVGSGTSDLQVKFSATTTASGTVGSQRFFGGLLEVDDYRMREGGV